MVFAVTAFVAHRPAENTNMGTVTQNHTLAAGDKCVFPTRFTAEAGVISVTLHIGFIQNIDTVLITEIIPHRIIRIMTGPHSIEIELFHQLDIIKHIFSGQDFSVFHIVFMTVDSPDQHSFAVEKQIAAIYSDIAESDAFTADIKDIPLTVKEFDNQCIQKVCLL